MYGIDQSYATVEDVLTSLAASETSSVRLVAEAIARITALDERLNAVCVRDFGRALAAAREADAARARGDTRPLLGVPMLVKESFNVAGLPTTWGIPPFKEFVVSEDAVAVARLKAAGAVVLGKTNVPQGLGDLQTYNALYGATNNPWDVTRTPGGSSGGSAAAVAVGYAPFSIGSDIAGSLRVPAHFCGIYAHKPTFGVVPTRGHVAPPARPLPYERDLSAVGPMARSAGDLALLFDILAGPDPLSTGAGYRLALPSPRHKQLRHFRVLVLQDHPDMPTAGNVRAAIGDLAQTLERAGAKVAYASQLLPSLTDAARLYMRLLMAAIAASLPPDAYEALKVQAQRLADDDQSLAAERLRGTAISHRDWIAADSERAALRRQWRALFAAHDVVICPVSPTTAFAHDQSPDPWSRRLAIDGADVAYADQLVWSGLASAAGLPATVAPIGRDGDNMPIGVQIIGPEYEDRTVLQFARLLERERGGFAQPFLG